MKSESFDPKIIIASALIGTSLFASTPVVRENLTRVQNSIYTTRQQRSIKLEEQLYNHRFQCSQTGIIVHFLSDAKAQLFDADIAQLLQGDYRIQFNRDIVMNIYKNPSKSFDLIFRDVTVEAEGFSANLNNQKRYFQKV
ncbi:MAG: hypothetical protein PHX13_11725 [Thiovulaceae bacterium]|nr:hypothetical protein [Sulfurimonadaceae bacterium]